MTRSSVGSSVFVSVETRRARRHRHRRHARMRGAEAVVLLGDLDRGQAAGALVEEVGGERGEAGLALRIVRRAGARHDERHRRRSAARGSRRRAATCRSSACMRLATGGLNVGSVVGAGGFVQSEMPDLSNGAAAPARRRDRGARASETRSERAAHHLFTTFLPGLIVSTTRAFGSRYFAAASCTCAAVTARKRARSFAK